MLRLSIFCLLAGAAFAAVLDGKQKMVVPDMPYTQNLRLVDQASERLYQNLATTQPDVRDTKFHYLLVAATVDKLGQRLYNHSLSETTDEAFKNTLNKELPELYRDLVKASEGLKQRADKANVVLEPLRLLKLKYCKNLDDKDCDQALEYQVQHLDLFDPARKAANVLKAGAKVAQLYLDLHEDMLEQGKGRLSLSYLLDNKKSLVNLAQKHAETLWAIELLQDDDKMAYKKSIDDKVLNSQYTAWPVKASGWGKIYTMI